VAVNADEGAVGEEPADAGAAVAVAVAVTVAKPWAVYLLHCEGSKSYIGISPAPQERYAAHLAGKGAAFTRSNRPVSLAAIVWFENRSAAASMEVRLKALARPAKLAWFQRFTATTATVPATLDDGLASLASRPLCDSI
jgi:putative endonuclease